jgi:hypothetical protein
VGTPVIDPLSQTIYFITMTKEADHFVQRLHAVDVASGDDRPQSPVPIVAHVPGTGYHFDNDATNEHYHDVSDDQGGFFFFAQHQLQRVALGFAAGTVFIAWGSHGDFLPYHGWVMAYDGTTLEQRGAFCTSPNNKGGGIWMAGGGVAIDDDGNAYVATGNGPFDYSGSYGDSMIKLGLDDSGLRVLDSFTPYNQFRLDTGDLDLGSGGLLLLPSEETSGRRLALAGGKEGTLYLVDRDNMGGYHQCTTDALKQLDICDDSQIVQAMIHLVPGAGGRLSYGDGIYNTPTFYKGRFFIHAGGDVLKAFAYDPIQDRPHFDETPLAQGSVTFTQVGATTIISANGDHDGIMWEVQQDTGQAVLHAYDAENYVNGNIVELYNSKMAGDRDQPGSSTRFTNPIVANGMVYVPGQFGLDVYGLFPDETETFAFTLSEKSFEPGVNTPIWHITGALPDTPIYWSSTHDGMPTGEYDTYGTKTDANGEFLYQGPPFDTSQAGQWTRTVQVGRNSGTVSYRIYPRAMVLALDDQRAVGESPGWTVTGADPNSAILWSSTLNSADTGEHDLDYGLVTDDQGNWSGTGSPWRSNDVGRWVRKIHVGDRIKTLGFEIVGPDGGVEDSP